MKFPICNIWRICALYAHMNNKTIKNNNYYIFTVISETIIMHRGDILSYPGT
jgi:hypothetical protein